MNHRQQPYMDRNIHLHPNQTKIQMMVVDQTVIEWCVQTLKSKNMRWHRFNMVFFQRIELLSLS